MAKLANTFVTDDAVGLREQLSDVIYNITPEETPILSAISRKKVKGTFNEWQTDALDAPDGANKQPEGNDSPTFAAITPTVRIGNWQQISTKQIIISDTEEEVDKAGRASELAYQTAKKGVELKRDMETILFATNQGASGTDPRSTASLLAWLRTNTDFEQVAGADPAAPNPAPAAGRTDGTLRNVTEQMLKDVVQAMWSAGANIGRVKVYVNGPMKAKFSAFSGIASQTVQINGPRPTSIIGSADVYVSEFGNLRILPSRLQRNRDVFLLDTSFLQIDQLRPFRRVPLAKTGDATKRMLLVEYGLRVKNEAALGAIYDVQ